MKNLAGKVAFITGAASGIGLALAKACATAHMKVMLADIDRAGLELAVNELSGNGADVDCVTCNVADTESVQNAARSTVERFGKVHLLVNNAGILGIGTAGETPLKDWRRCIDVNLMGPVHGVQVFLPLIRSHKEGGHILNTASVGGHVGFAGWAPYCTTKHAVIGFSECLSSELNEENIGVSVLCPGLVNTRIAEIDRYQAGSAGKSSENEEALNSISTAVGSGMSADIVAAFALEQVQKGAFYIFTHPGTRGEVEERYPIVSAAFTDTENSELINSDPDSQRIANKDDVEGLAS
jgi:NAD(P)-dependent dehydrogenase (short-subunit alcohol dehydrogenase family)